MWHQFTETHHWEHAHPSRSDWEELPQGVLIVDGVDFCQWGEFENTEAMDKKDQLYFLFLS